MCSSSFEFRASALRLGFSSQLFLSAFLSMLGGVMFRHPLAIAAAGDITDPIFVFKIPADSFSDAALKCLQRMPVQFALDFARVHRVPAVVTRAVFDERDELAVRHGGVVRAQLVKQFANGSDNFEVSFFASPADVVGFSDAALGEHGANGAAMILDVEPVANVFAVAIHREWLAGTCIQDHERDQLLGKLVGAVVIGAVGGQNRKAVSVVISADQMIGSRLGRGVRTVGIVGGGLAESWIVGAERSVDFVGGDVEETERGAINFRKRQPIGACFFKQTECAVDIGADEIIGTVDGAVDVALGGEVNNGARLFAPQQVAQEITIDDVALLETIVCVRLDGTQVVEIARVGQLVEIQDAGRFRGDPLENEVRANKARATGDEDEIFHAGYGASRKDAAFRF